MSALPETTYLTSIPTPLLADEVALVSGGGTGIGRGIAETFGALGARVAVMGRRRDRLDETVEAIHQRGGQAIAVTGDVCSPGACEQVVQAVLDAFGTLTTLVNNAGLFISGEPEQLSDSEYERQMGVNVKGAFLMMKATLRHLIRSQGCILNIGSAVVSRPLVGQSLYVASKHALAGLTRAWAADLAARRVRCNCIHPGVVRSEIAEAAGVSSAEVAKSLAALAALHPLGRHGQPADIGAAAAFLCSRAATWITGAQLDVDGGLGLGVIRI